MFCYVMFITWLRKKKSNVVTIEHRKVTLNRKRTIRDKIKEKEKKTSISRNNKGEKKKDNQEKTKKKKK